MLDEKGFKRKRFADLYDEMEAKAEEAFGADINTSARTPLGIILRLFAWFLSIAWSNSEDTYNSAYVKTAGGVQLDRLGPYVGISRILERQSNGAVNITGVAGRTVLAGFRLTTATGILFETVSALTLDGDGRGAVQIQAVEPGRNGNVSSGTISTIVNPNPNVTSVINTTETSGGREKETDMEFRERFSLSVAGGGAATLASIQGALLRVPGVRAATVIENTTAVIDSGGRPSKSFEAFVLGGAATDVAQVVLDTKAAGIETYGTQSVSVNDLSGNPHIIKFSYAQQVLVYIRATIKKNASYPVDGNTRIKTAAIQLVGGTDADGTVYVGQSMGQNVVQSRLVAAVYSVDGLDDVKLEVSTNGTTWTQANITILPQQVAQTNHTIITVVLS